MSSSKTIKFLKIKDFAVVKTGGTPSTHKKEYWNNGNIPWLNSGALNSGIITYSKNYITDEGLRNSAAKLMPPNTVLIALTGATTGVTALLKIDACANQSVTGVLPSDSHDSSYLFYYLRNIRGKIISESYGGAQKHISQEYVKNLVVPLPSLIEQKRIAAILDKASEIKAKREQAIVKLDELAQSVFLEMFGDPVVNPKNLKKQKLTEFFKFKTGKLDSNAAIENGKYPFFTCSKDNFLINEFAFDEEALLLAGNNANGDYSVKYYSGRFNAYQRTYVINLANSDNTYEYAKSSLEFMLAQMKRRSKGTSTKYLTMSLFDEMTILVPSKSLQEKYGQIIKKIEDLKRKELIKSAVISNLIYSLQHQAFTRGLNA